MAASFPDVAARWANARRLSGLSREGFAERTGLSPGAVWRVETHGRLKPGELEKLEAAFPTSGDQVPAKAPETPETPPGPVASTDAPATRSSPFEEDLETVQWLDTGLTKSEVPSPAVTLVSDPVVLIGGDVSSVALVTPVDPSVEPTIKIELSPLQMFSQDGIRRVSHSEIRAFRRCRRSWYLTYYRRLIPTVEGDTGARAIGDRIHRALRWHYHSDLTRRTDVRDAIEQVISFDWDAIQKRHHERGQLVPGELRDAFTRESDLERIMVEGYVDWLETQGADSDLQVVASEAYLEAELPNLPDVRLVGKIDARFRRVSDGLRLFMDHKTTGAFGPLVRMLPLDEQMLFYMLLERYQDDDVRCVGAVYNMLRKVRRTPRANPPFYMRVEVHHNRVELDSFEVRVRGILEDMTELRRRLDDGADPLSVAYPLPGHDCITRCNFHKVCPMFDDGSRVGSALNAHFTVGDPTGYYVRGV